MRGYNNYNNNYNRYRERPMCPPPKQIPFKISAPQVKKWCTDKYLANDFESIWRLHNAFKIVRRSIMQLESQKPESIDIDIIREVEKEPGFDVLTIVSLPQTTKYFDVNQWVYIYFAMLPDHTCLKLTNYKAFNNDLELIFRIYADIKSVWATVNKDKLKAEAADLKKNLMCQLNNSYNKVLNYYEHTFENEQDITKYVDSWLYGKINQFSEKVIWADIDMYRDYLKVNSLNWDDLRTQMIFREVTFDPIILPSGFDYIDNFENMFSLVDLPASEVYPMMDVLRTAGQLFYTFKEDNNITADTTLAQITQQQWEDYTLRHFFNECITVFALRHFSFRSRLYIQQYQLPLYAEADFVKAPQSYIEFIGEYKNAFESYYRNTWETHCRMIKPSYNGLGILDLPGRALYKGKINTVCKKGYIRSFVCFSQYDKEQIWREIAQTIISIIVGYEDTFQQSVSQGRDYQIALLLTVGQFHLCPDDTAKNIVIEVLKQNERTQHKFEFWALLLYHIYVYKVFNVNKVTWFREYFEKATSNVKYVMLFALYYLFSEFTEDFDEESVRLLLETCDIMLINAKGFNKCCVKFIFEKVNDFIKRRSVTNLTNY